MFKKLKKHLLPIFLLILSALALMFIFITSPYHQNHDTVIHLANIEETKNAITIENLYPNEISKHIANDFGYGNRLFYPPLGYLTAGYSAKILDTTLGVGTLDTMKIVYTVSLLLSGFTMYFFSYKLLKSRKLAFLSGLIYMAIPYHLSDIYVRDAIAETFLFPFLPLILLGVYNLLEGNKKAFYPQFIIGYVGGILSHFTMMLYFTFFLAIFLLIYHKKVFKKDFLLPFILATILTILITGFFLESMLIHKLFGNYVAFQEGAMAGKIWGLGNYPWDFLLNYPTNGVNHSFPILVSVLLLLVFLWRKKLSFPKYTKGFITFGLLAYLMTTYLFPWDILPSSFRILQFPWRLETFLALIVSLYAPTALQNKSVKLVAFFACFILINSIAFTRFGSDTIYNLENRNYNDGMGWQMEYLPVKTKENLDYFNSRDHEIHTSDGTAFITLDDVPNLNFSISSVTDTTIVELPRIYYFGYVLKDESGTTYKLEESPYGFLQVELTDGNYYLTYEGTTLNKILKKVSLGTIVTSLVVYIGYLSWDAIYKKRKKPYNKNEVGEISG